MQLKQLSIYRTIIICFAISHVTFLKVFAQNNIDQVYLEERAKSFFQSRNYYQALPLYQKLDSIQPDFPNYIYPLGICYMNTSYDAKNALTYLEKCNAYPHLYPQTLNYYLAKAYHLSEKFDVAIKYYEDYMRHIRKKGKREKAIINDVHRQIEMCHNGIELSSHPINIKIVNLGTPINTEYPEYGAVISADEKELIFTSSRPNTTGGNKDAYDGHYFEDIYITYKLDDTTWSEPVNMPSPQVNTTGHDASISLSPDGQQLIVYRFTSDNMLTAASGDLFISELNGDQWTNAVKLPENINSKGWEPSACLAKDGRLMFFTSSREGSIGGTDIYMIKKLPNGEWALPTNLGSTINTPYNEDSPYLHPDGKTLYFSSEGHNSMGGYDLFVTEYNEEKNTWSRPKNVGYPLSTAHDDIHFTFSADGKRAFFSTNRSDSYGDKDIYYAVLEEKEANHVLVVKGFVVDSLSNAPIKAIITVYDQNNSSVVGVYSSNESSGKYIMVLPEGKDFTLTVESENYKLCGDHISTLDIKDYTEVNKDIKLCPVNIPDKPIELPK